MSKKFWKGIKSPILLILWWLILFPVWVWAAAAPCSTDGGGAGICYVNTASSGGDGTTTAITGAQAAFATIATVNGYTYAAGDQILFNRGQTWSVTTLTIPSSGSVGSPITFGAYGTGTNPIIFASSIVDTNTKNYLTFQYINLSGQFYCNSSTNITVNYCLSSNSSARGFLVNSSTTVTINNCLIYNSTLAGIETTGATTTLALKNSVIIGCGVPSSYGIVKTAGTTFSYDYCLITGNNRLPSNNINETGLTDGGYNLKEYSPKFVTMPHSESYFSITIDDLLSGTAAYLNDVVAALPAGNKVTVFPIPIYQDAGRIAALNAAAVAGNEIGVHSYSHQALNSTTAFTVTTTNASPIININRTTKTLTLTGGGPFSSWNTTYQGTKISATEAAARGTGVGFQFVNDNTTTVAYLQRSIVSSPTVHLIFYVKFPDAANWSDGVNEVWELSPTYGVYFKRNGTNMQMYSSFLGDVGGYYTICTTSDTNWHKIESHIKASSAGAGYHKLWIDDASQLNNINITTAQTNTTVFWLGASYISAGIGTGSFYIDDITVTDGTTTLWTEDFPAVGIITLDWSSIDKIISDLKTAVSGQGWTITNTTNIYDSLFLSSLSDSGGNQTTFPYVANLDISAGNSYPFWTDEIGRNITWINSNIGIAPTTLSYPFGVSSAGLITYLKDVATLNGAANAESPLTNMRLSSLAIYNITRIGVTGLLTDTTEATARLVARHIGALIKSVPAIYVLYAHDATELPINQVGWILDELNSLGIYSQTFASAISAIRSSHSTADDLLYTKTYTTTPDFHLQSTSPAIDAGIDVSLTTDYYGNRVPQGYGNVPDIGMNEITPRRPNIIFY